MKLYTDSELRIKSGTLELYAIMLHSLNVIQQFLGIREAALFFLDKPVLQSSPLYLTTLVYYWSVTKDSF